jgi:hypothetical protein
MENYAAILGALDAGKLPTQKQINGTIEWMLQGPLIQVESSEMSGTLSDQGKAIAGALREVLDAHKRAGINKNGDDALQEAMWNLSQGDTSNMQAKLSTEGVDGSVKDEVVSDAQRLASALRNLISLFLSYSSAEGTSLFSDFASFSRSALANTAELVEQQARAAKESLRRVEQEVQDGQRDNLGRKKDEDNSMSGDPQAQFEAGMDTIKSAGSTAIGAGQSAAQTVQESYNSTTNRLQLSMDKITKRAQKDEQYHDTVTTIFDLFDKWFNKTLDSANAAQFITLDSFVDDPTGRVPNAIRMLRTVAERFAGGKPLDDLFSAVNRCMQDLRDDQELKQYFNDYFRHVRKTLHQPEYAKSEECKNDTQKLSQRWKELTSFDSDARRKFNKDFAMVNKEINEYNDRFQADEDIVRLRQAYQKLADTFSQAMTTLGGTGGVVDQYSWMMQDMLNAYVPRVLSMIKSVPIPRVEYKDPEAEFVLENVDISSLKILPGHAHFKTTTEMDISQKDASADAKTNFSTRTNVQFQGLQITLRDVSFYYKDLTANLGPDTFTGILDMHLPEKGIDVELTLSMIPTADVNKRQDKKKFHTIDNVSVSLHDDLDVSVRDSNHSILVTVLKPLIRNRFRETLETTIKEQIRFALNWLDFFAFDVHQRAGVFTDAGAPSSVAYIGGFWSKIGAMRKEPGGLFEGMMATGAGFIKDDPNDDVKFAMGTAPQILAGSKRGPISPFTGEGAITSDDLKGAAQDVQVQARQAAAAGQEVVYTFRRLVRERRAEEERKDGWRSSAFDALAVPQ